VYQVGINKGIILRCTAYQISSFTELCVSDRYSQARCIASDWPSRIALV